MSSSIDGAISAPGEMDLDLNIRLRQVSYIRLSREMAFFEEAKLLRPDEPVSDDVKHNMMRVLFAMCDKSDELRRSRDQK